IIGLAYAIAAAVAILVIDKAPHGAEHIKEILTGSILWVKWETIRNAAIIYSLVGIFHYIFRRQFILISENPQKAYEKGMSVRFWDFLFYVSFGIVITHSVGTAGVLLVFVFLVVPAITSMLITDVLWKQLIIGWTMGVFVSAVGLYISYSADLPSGPTVVSFYGITLIAVALFLFIKRAELRNKAIMKVGLGLGVSLVIIFGFYLLGNAFRGSHTEEHDHAEVVEQISDIHDSHRNPVLDELSEIELENYLSEITEISELTLMFHHEKDEYTQLKIANRMSEISKKEGYLLLIAILKNGELPFVKEEACLKIRENSGQDFGYDPIKSLEENQKAITEIENWVETL
ncbi:MAG: metal ABC transporter permease, partial [Melioribacteraceae bacterium]|nr:metal ABC transporter permease [Melioribacteraceae bacterium]